jgi:hypothetical protein
MHEPYRDDVTFTTLRARHSRRQLRARHVNPNCRSNVPNGGGTRSWGSFDRPVESKTFFLETAREIGVGTDNDPASFERAFRKVVQPVPASPKPSVVKK